MNVFCWRSAEQCAAFHEFVYLGESFSNFVYLREKRSDFANLFLYTIGQKTFLSTLIWENRAQKSQKYQCQAAKQLKVVFYPMQKHTFWCFTPIRKTL